MNTLTVIIPFLNEGIEIERTLKSIRSTSGKEVKILLIDDASTDKIDYKSLAKRFHAEYFKNKKRLGVAASRDMAVKLCQTEYFLIIDGHMRFYANQWSLQLINILNHASNQLYCCNTRHLNPDATNQGGKSYGAFLDILQREDPANIINVRWIEQDPDPTKNIIEIPAVLGASYASSKTFWKHIKGLKGLISYGSDEEYLSLKTWLSGSRCYLLKDIFIGHIYRTNESREPFYIKQTEVWYNKMWIVETLFDKKHQEEACEKLSQNIPYYAQMATQLIQTQQNQIRELRKYFQSIQKRELHSLISYNKSIRQLCT